MSYILDALRRADSERDRGAVPGIHAQPVPMSSAGALRERPPIAPWIAAAAALLVIAVLAWRLLDRDAPRNESGNAATAPLQAPTSLPTSLPTTAPPMPSTSPATQAATQQTAPAVATTQAPSTTTLPPMPATPARALRRVPPALDRPLANQTDALPDTAVARAPTTAATTVAPATSSKGLIYNRTELPAEVQRQLPNLQVGGATFSRDAASRMLIINGQIFHEGDTLAPDLTLDQIELKAAVFRFKGYRYRMTF